MKRPPLSHYAGWTFAMVEAISDARIARTRRAFERWRAARQNDARQPAA